MDTNISNRLLEDLKKESQRLTTTDGKPLEIPVKGSLGLLALGAKGLFAWREKRKLMNPKTGSNEPE
ncbi:MAG: hypothetical protein KKA07_11735 [Bacteroidetes bacterium]|nr:hypothetical protein [Bacteroidota bacterium]MBU1719730.1 hypothetical protein [Bacteroidota bacterium]